MMAICCLSVPENPLKLRQRDFDWFNSQNDLNEKIFEMANFLHLTPGEIEERQYICAEITNLLKPYYPDCLVIPFGSSVNGFGFKGCDLDLLFLPFPEYCNLDFKEKGKNDNPNLSDVLQGTYPKEDLLALKESYHLKFIQCIMRTRKRYFFKRIVFIPAKCPILNLTFVQSRIECDFSASNRLVISNTKLLMLFGALDPRVKPLMMVLRFWAKSLGFIKKSRLSSYAFSFLVVFYLQNTQPPVLPSVKHLIELAGYSQKIDDWETAICLDVEAIPKTENRASIDELLRGFLEFYWNFDFIRNIVSPYNGKKVPVKDIMNSADERIKTFRVSLFSIQDPFILSLNISRHAGMMTSFKFTLLIAKRLLLSENFLFQKFFDFSFYEKELDALFTPTLQLYHASSVCTTLRLTHDLCSKLGITTQVYPWYEKACQTVFDVLQYGLLYECEVVDKGLKTEPPRKKKKISYHNAGNLELIMSIQCAVYYYTWRGRKKMENLELKTDEKTFSGTLKKLHDVSRNIIGKGKTGQPPILWFSCDCFKYSDAQMADVVVILSPITNINIFCDMSRCTKSYIEKHAMMILMED